MPTGLELIDVPAGPCADRRPRRGIRLRQRAPAPPARAARVPHRALPRDQRRLARVDRGRWLHAPGVVVSGGLDLARAGAGRPAGRLDRRSHPRVAARPPRAASTRRDRSSTSPSTKPRRSPPPTGCACRPSSSGRRPPRGTPRPASTPALAVGRGRACGPAPTPTSISSPAAPRGRAACRAAPRRSGASRCSATSGSGRAARSIATRASPPTRTGSTPRSSSARTTASCAAARGRPAPGSRRVPFRNWDFPQRRQIFAGLRLAGDA